ncbi:MAG TPA: class I SAM-dependent methyltransferase, partial [Pirellulales bacterium]|nr:class I SAM-dependent methyltransferase [Pirellulales bacterium]
LAGRAELSRANGLKALWLAYFSQPAADRILYRTIRKRKLRRIVEIGIGGGRRALRMISLAKRYRSANEVRYTGIDWFESRAVDSDQALSMKQAYRLLRGTSARIHLIPNDANEAFARLANALSANELIVISSEEPPESLGRIWFFLPRMLAPGAVVLFSRIGEANRAWREISLKEIKSLGVGHRRRAA